jgi:hypothetical protein
MEMALTQEIGYEDGNTSGREAMGIVLAQGDGP